MKAFSFNKIIVYLTLSDVFTWGLINILNGFVGIYLAIKLGDNAVEFVGIGLGVSNLMKALLQIPLGNLTDKIRKDLDEIMVLFFGNLLMGLPFLFYPLIKSEYLFYCLQGILGAGMALNLVSWRKLFATHIDHGKEGVEYGTYDTVMSISIALFGFVAGYVANLGDKYFDIVMVTISLLIMSSTLWAYFIYRVERRP